MSTLLPVRMYIDVFPVFTLDLLLTQYVHFSQTIIW